MAGVAGHSFDAFPSCSCLNMNPLSVCRVLTLPQPSMTNLFSLDRFPLSANILLAVSRFPRFFPSSLPFRSVNVPAQTGFPADGARWGQLRALARHDPTKPRAKKSWTEQLPGRPSEALTEA